MKAPCAPGVATNGVQKIGSLDNTPLQKGLTPRLRANSSTQQLKPISRRRSSRVGNDLLNHRRPTCNDPIIEDEGVVVELTWEARFSDPSSLSDAGVDCQCEEGWAEWVALLNTSLTADQCYQQANWSCGMCQPKAKGK